MGGWVGGWLAGLSGNIDHLNPIEVEIEVGLGLSLATDFRHKAYVEPKMFCFGQSFFLTETLT